MMKNLAKKGFVTISVLLVSLSLILLLGVISNYSNSMKNVNNEVLGLQSLGAQADAVSYSFKALLQQTGISIGVSGANVTFGYYGSAASLYPTKASRLSDFFTGNSRPGNLTIGANATRPRFYVKPYNVTVDCGAGSLDMTPQTAALVNGYDVAVKIGKPGVSFNTSGLSVVPNTSTDAIYFHMGVQGSDGAVGQAFYLNKTVTNTLAINYTGGSMSAQVGPQSALRWTGDPAAWVGATVLLNSTGANGSTYVELGETLINLRLDDGTEWHGPMAVGN